MSCRDVRMAPIASDLEVATKAFIPAPESQGNLHYQLQWQKGSAHAFCNTGFVLHCWNTHFLDSKYKFLLDLNNVTWINSIRYQIRWVLAQTETQLNAQGALFSFLYFCKYGCSYELSVPMCTAKQEVWSSKLASCNFTPLTLFQQQI